MKIIQYLFSVIIIAGFVCMFSCKPTDGGDKPTEQQKQAEKLAGTWSVSAVDLKPSGVDNSYIDGLSMTFGVDDKNNPTTFSASGAPDFFATQSSSAWSWSGTSTTNILLSAVTPVDQLTITSLDGTTLKITFEMTTARVESLEGTYELTMTK